MSTIYTAEINPEKPVLIRQWLDQQYWGGEDETEVLGSYRFDDPEGEVGFEGFMVSRGESVLHLPLTYRAAPLDGAEDYLVTTMQHSVLGSRWIYDAMADPVGVHILNLVLAGELEQATEHYFREDGEYLGTEEPSVSVYVRGELPEDWGHVSVHHLMDTDDEHGGELRRLVGRWGDSSATLFELTPPNAPDSDPISSGEAE